MKSVVSFCVACLVGFSITPALTAAPSPFAKDDVGLLDAAHSPLRVRVLANDVENSGTSALTITAVAQPAHGTAVIDGTAIVYTAGADFPGLDEFTYTISDTFGTTATAKVSIGEFSAAVGTYRGVIKSDTYAFGRVRVTISAAGELTGVVQDSSNSALNFPFHGAFGNNGTFSGQPPGNPIDCTVTFDPQTRDLTAFFGYDSLTPFSISRLIRPSKPNPWAGKYTFRDQIGAFAVSSADPLGSAVGWGAITVSPVGNVHLAGTLPDGGAIIVDGTLIDSFCFFDTGVIYPGYISGHATGYIDLDPNGYYVGDPDEPAQTYGRVPGPYLVWSRTVRRPGTYPVGAAHYTRNAIFGVSRYVPATPPIPATVFSAATFTYTYPGTSDLLTQPVAWTADNQLQATDSNPDGLVVRVNNQNGLFSGSFRDPNTNIKYLFGGALFQSGRGGGVGSFSGGGRRGVVYLNTPYP